MVPYSFKTGENYTRTFKHGNQLKLNQNFYFYNFYLSREQLNQKIIFECEFSARLKKWAKSGDFSFFGAGYLLSSFVYLFIMQKTSTDMVTQLQMQSSN